MSQPLLHVKSSNFARLYEEDRDLRGKLLEEYRTLCVVMVYQVGNKSDQGLFLEYAAVKIILRSLQDWVCSL